MTSFTTQDGGCRFPVAYRCILAMAQIATVIITWRLWSTREYPPLLPLFPVPQFGMHGLVIASCVVSMRAPRVGLPLQAMVLLWSIVSDQCRMQPEMLSMHLLCWGTVRGSPGGVVVARASLAALWFFSGVHKLLSPDYLTTTVPWLLGAMGLPRDGLLRVVCGVGVGAAEVLLGVGCLVPSLRRAVAVAACAFHLVIVAVLSPLGIDWNPEVLPWNAALACSGFALIAPWRDQPPGVAWHNASWFARAVTVAILCGPGGYWLGVVDASLAHCLYSDDTPRAFVCTPFDRRDLRLMCLDAGIRLPPAHRLFEPMFLSMGRSGEWLEIEDPRAIARWWGWAPKKVPWSDLVPADAEIVAPGSEDTGTDPPAS